MGTLHRQIMMAYLNVIKTRDKFRIQDLVDWINANGGVNGCNVNRGQVKRGIVTILERKGK